jgi:hypothetical protein
VPMRMNGHGYMPIQGGDYGRTDEESEYQRPKKYWGLQALIAGVKLIVFTLYEAVLIGSWHWAIMLGAAIMSLTEFNAEDIKLEIRLPSRSDEFFLMSFFSGLFSAVMALLGAGIWPNYYIIEGRMSMLWEGFSLRDLHPVFIWLRFILACFPVMLLRPTYILDWVAKIESIIPRYRSTNFTQMDPKNVETPIGSFPGRDIPAPIVPAYPELPIVEEDEEEREYIISDSAADVTEVNV